MVVERQRADRRPGKGYDPAGISRRPTTTGLTIRALRHDGLSASLRCLATLLVSRRCSPFVAKPWPRSPFEESAETRSPRKGLIFRGPCGCGGPQPLAGKQVARLLLRDRDLNACFSRDHVFTKCLSSFALTVSRPSHRRGAGAMASLRQTAAFNQLNTSRVTSSRFVSFSTSWRAPS
jgi:hypothetical protein